MRTDSVRPSERECSSRWKRLVGVLSEMGDVLRTYGHTGQAEVTERLTLLAADDDDAFLDLLQGAEVWGGSGAVWEVADLGADQSRYWALVVALAGAMAKEDVETERVRSVAESLSRWPAV